MPIALWTAIGILAIVAAATVYLLHALNRECASLGGDLIALERRVERIEKATADQSWEDD